MKTSAFFADLASTYAYEIEDLTYDSAGDDVLKKRLAEKRAQFAGLLPLCASDPSLVAPAFSGAFRVLDRAVLDDLVARDAETLPSWESVAAALEIAPWAAPLVAQARAADGGPAFLVIAAGLEYLQGRHAGAGAVAAVDDGDDADADADDGGDEEDARADDLGDAGEDWLGDQGFDRRS
ncbi:MAG: hypothetical protein JNM90_25570 [Burkholderiales bacterium]|nr:hypothetical protein [Burkholderiales bacterium]